MSNYPIAYSSSTFTLAGNVSGSAPKAPTGLIVTKASQTKGGWLGQVFVDGQIVWESEHCSFSENAVEAANQRVVDVISNLFTKGTKK